MKLATVAEMHRLEQAAVDGGSSFAELMERAGRAAAQEAWMLLGGTPGRTAVVLAGPGNNGGDGLVAARHLHDWGAKVQVFTSSERARDANAAELDERGVTLHAVGDAASTEHLQQALNGATVVIDALLGTGRGRPIDPASGVGLCLRALVVAREASAGPRLLAVDVPTGLDCDGGALDPLAVTPDMTLTFGLAKVGLFQEPGAGGRGEVEVADIGLPKAEVAGVQQELLTARWAAARLPARQRDGNKGSFGRVLLVGGSRNYSGAMLLTGRAAYRAGAGLVTVACPAPVHERIATTLPEATWLPQAATDEGGLDETAAPTLRDTWPDFAAAVVGPGMGNTEATRAFLWASLPDMVDAANGVVIDADALNGLAMLDDGTERVPSNAVLTPHPGEMARLLKTTVVDVQSRRVDAVREAAARFGCVVVLKGACTVIASPGGCVRIAPFSNPLLATAGTGDVLAGCIAGYLAQGVAPAEAASLGVLVHGTAGERLGKRYGFAGLLAGELADELPLAAREIEGRKCYTVLSL